MAGVTRTSRLYPRHPLRCGFTVGLATSFGLAATLAFDARVPAQADSRAAAYSIHMLAKIPSRCTLRDVGRFIFLTRDTPYGDSAVEHGRARFRVECNVPYVLDTSTRQNSRRSGARLIPLAAEGGDLTMPLLPDEARTHSTESATTTLHFDRCPRAHRRLSVA